MRELTGIGRVGTLDKIVSKHLALTASKGAETVHFLVVHLIRPIGKQEEKHQRQLTAITQWAEDFQRLHPKDTIVILGDANSDQTPLLAVGTEAGEQNQWAATHLTGKPFDRLIASPHTPRPILLNAWESDYCGDPLLAIVTGLIRALETKQGETNATPASKPKSLIHCPSLPKARIGALDRSWGGIPPRRNTDYRQLSSIPVNYPQLG